MEKSAPRAAAPAVEVELLLLRPCGEVVRTLVGPVVSGQLLAGPLRSGAVVS